jgi:glycosyltransferase involved in cell wall biosynthesis
MPVYNSATTIGEAIDSVVRQTMPDWRLVIADNASTDDTRAIAQRYAASDDRISVLEHRQNLGQAANFASVFDGTDTEYFVWLCGDDRFAPNYLADCLAALDAEQDLIGVFMVAEAIDGDGVSLGRFTERPGVDRDSPDLATRFSASVHATVGFAMFGVYRTEALAASPLLEPYVGSDRVLAGALSLIGPIRELPDIGFHRRFHPAQFSRAVNTNRDRYRSYAGREAPRLRPLWPTRIAKLAGLAWQAPYPLSDRLAVLRVVFGSFTVRILKGEVTMLVRTGAKHLGRLTGRNYDVMGWLASRGRSFEAATEQPRS